MKRLLAIIPEGILLLTVGLCLMACRESRPTPTGDVEHLPDGVVAEPSTPDDQKEACLRLLERVRQGDEEAKQALAAELDGAIDEQSRRIETQLEAWLLPCEGPYEPPEDLRCPRLNIEGTWRARGGHDGSVLVIEQLFDDVYQVSFSTYACLSRWRLTRAARYADGVLELNRAVQEYFPLTYDRLYALWIEGEGYLLPAVCPERFAHLKDRGETVEGPYGRRFYMYKRRDPAQDP
jgi:hypothetical protein